MYLLILVLPLLGSLLVGFSGRWFGHYGSAWLAISCVSLSFVFSIMAFLEIGFSNTIVYILLKPWLHSGLLQVEWSFLFDSLTVIMLIVITSISTLVHIYSVNYMSEDPHFPRFLAFLEIFTFFMLILVTADNLLQMFLGWEGVGLASYLLINFWFTRLSANKSAIKALVVNRIGDFGLILAILAIFYLFQSINYFTIFSLVPFFIDYFFSFLGLKLHALTFISIFLFIGAIGKSAQLGLHTWLPDAMEGPTPVSALIHAATMVTAGVFLLIRFSPLLEFSPLVLVLFIMFGSFTAFFGSLVGLFQNDLKKVIAYSTCSQLGYMIFCCGLSCYNISIFHLTNHAFFKALLFLAAGSVIHAISDEQDMRKMGALVNFLPLTYTLMLVGSLALVGFPFLTGFYSKDLILEISNVFRNGHIVLLFGNFACWFGNFAVLFTAFYSFRLIYLTFINNFNSERNSIRVIKEASSILLFPLFILGGGSIFFGYLSKEIFIGLGSDFLNNAIFIFPSNYYIIESEFLALFLKWIPLFLTLGGIILATCINLQIFKLKMKWLITYNFLLFLINKKWYIDILFNKFIVLPLLNFGYEVSFKSLDRGFIELIGPFGLTSRIREFGGILSKYQSGQLSQYIFYLIISLCLIILNSSWLNLNYHEFIFYFILVLFL